MANLINKPLISPYKRPNQRFRNNRFYKFTSKRNYTAEIADLIEKMYGMPTPATISNMTKLVEENVKPVFMKDL